MTKRRSLTDGVKPRVPTNSEQEVSFVYGQPGRPQEPTTPTSQAAGDRPAGTKRLPLTTRLRADLVRPLKRAALTRELTGQTPNTVQEILEEALEPWLREHGYLGE